VFFFSGVMFFESGLKDATDSAVMARPTI